MFNELIFHWWQEATAWCYNSGKKSVCYNELTERQWTDGRTACRQHRLYTATDTDTNK